MNLWYNKVLLEGDVLTRIFIFLLVLLSSDMLWAQILTDDQMEDLQTRVVDTAKNKKILFYGAFEQQKLDPKNIRDKDKINSYKRTGKVPFRLWAECGEIVVFKDGRTRPELFALSTFFYIMDEKKNVILKQHCSLSKMVNNGGIGGYAADLPGPGTYTCVIYVKKDNMLLGEKYTTTFEGYK